MSNLQNTFEMVVGAGEIFTVTKDSEYPNGYRVKWPGCNTIGALFFESEILAKIENKDWVIRKEPVNSTYPELDAAGNVFQVRHRDVGTVYTVKRCLDNQFGDTCEVSWISNNSTQTTQRHPAQVNKYLQEKDWVIYTPTVSFELGDYKFSVPPAEAVKFLETLKEFSEASKTLQAAADTFNAVKEKLDKYKAT